MRKTTPKKKINAHQEKKEKVATSSESEASTIKENGDDEEDALMSKGPNKSNRNKTPIAKKNAQLSEKNSSSNKSLTKNDDDNESENDEGDVKQVRKLRQKSDSKKDTTIETDEHESEEEQPNKRQMRKNLSKEKIDSKKVNSNEDKKASAAHKNKTEKKRNDDSEDNENYEVDDIIDHKLSRGKLMYRIRWKGFCPEDDTWEPESTLACPDIVKKYIEAHPNLHINQGNKRKTNMKKTEKKSAKKPKRSVNNDVDDNSNDEENIDKDWEVQRILDIHYNRNGTKEFLIRWKGYKQESDTWEPEDNLNCPELIAKYMIKIEEAKTSGEKELRPIRKHTNRFTLMQNARDRRLSKRNDGRQRTVYYGAE